MAKCRKCGREWKGKEEGHCSGCCEHFKSSASFDKHRIWVNRRTKLVAEARRCLTIEEMFAKGMIYNEDKKYWTGEKNPRWVTT